MENAPILMRCYLYRWLFCTCICYAAGMPGVLFADQGAATGDSWTSATGADGASRQHSPDGAENRIIKWCQEGGSHIRYASANIKLAGYRPCGGLETSAACDASGNRLIGKSPDKAYGYRDCGTPRIFISNYSEDDVVDTSNAFRPEDEKDQVEPLSSRERQDLERAFKEIKTEQDPALALQAQISQVIQHIFSQMGAVPSGNGNSGSRSKQFKEPQFKNQNQQELRRRLEELLKGMDPQTRRSVEQMLRQHP